ncbi:MAG: helix-turn-helix domain-containing protein [Gemmatimonadota bacterium]|nr:MAG: helix-turn-helix domain-containing protein [Gemmatimonadota bacterium]
MKQQKDDTWLTTGQAARLCSVTSDTVLKWIKKGSLDAVRTAGGHYRIRRRDLEPLLTVGRISRRIPDMTRGETQQLRCWEYFSRGGAIREECEACAVYRARAARCFRMAMMGAEIGHARQFCQTSCEDCVYFQRLSGLPTNVLVVTSDRLLVQRLQDKEYDGIALRFARNAYEASAAVHSFLPAFAVVDQDAFPRGDDGLLEGLANDPRLPGLKIIVAVRRGEDRQLGRSQDQHVISRVIEKPFGLEQIAALIDGFPVGSMDVEALENA